MKINCKVVTLIMVLAFEFATVQVLNAQQTLLQITAPANGSVATEGQTLNITVSAE